MQGRRHIFFLVCAVASFLCGLAWDGVAFAQQPSPASSSPPAGPSVSADAMGAPAGQPPGCEDATSSSFWLKVPPVLPFSRPGLFVIWPDGPGYYSLRDCLQGDYREGPPKGPYPRTSITFGPFSDADFRYLDDPKNTQFDVFDPLKRIHFGESDDWLLSLGGEERLRYMDDVNKRLTGKDNSFLLERTRLYGDLWFRDLFRVYVEYLDAQSSPQSLPPLAIDVNHSDLINLFADAKVGEFDGKPIYARIGRQDMCYGSYRLIATADWDNTRRAFEGAKLFWHDEKWSVDAFWVRPVLVSPSHFDAADHEGVAKFSWGHQGATAQ